LSQGQVNEIIYHFSILLFKNNAVQSGCGHNPSALYKATSLAAPLPRKIARANINSMPNFHKFKSFYQSLIYDKIFIPFYGYNIFLQFFTFIRAEKKFSVKLSRRKYKDHFVGRAAS